MLVELSASLISTVRGWMHYRMEDITDVTENVTDTVMINEDITECGSLTLDQITLTQMDDTSYNSVDVSSSAMRS